MTDVRRLAARVLDEEDMRIAHPSIYMRGLVCKQQLTGPPPVNGGQSTCRSWKRFFINQGGEFGRGLRWGVLFAV